MSSDYQPLHPDPRQPDFRPPSRACNSHCHVFGPKATFRFAPEATYQPVDAGKELLCGRHRHLGLERGVIVQASCHGTDSRAMVDAVPFARHLVERFSDRVLWGTDWPHPNIEAPMPDDGDLVDPIPLIAPSAVHQRALLVGNPTRLSWS